ncbi:MAG: dTDP-4-dehydrorhamnose 3,5-epimerase [Gemmatimonadetes bacterium]|nr:dTDP-4-dehydrorhamnose 3,5-epimerase [Gemmatimonadota bacterium]
MPFRFQELDLPGLVLVEETRHGDDRGFFAETYRRSAFAEAGITEAFVQDNHARSSRGVLRGLHYQLPPRAQGKLVRVVRGEVFDVAVDLRRDSPTYGRWAGVGLSGDDGRALWVPPGFAHGYAVLSEQADLLYKVTAEYAPDLERGVRWDDPDVGVAWPLAEPLLSRKDLELPPLADADNPFTLGAFVRDGR